MRERHRASDVRLRVRPDGDPRASGGAPVDRESRFMFSKTAAFRDALDAASGKRYGTEAEALARALRARKPHARTLLDVGCGTGAHLAEFARLGFACRGIDNDPQMIALARARCPDVEIDCVDMHDFDLAARFDVVVALSGTTAYARLPARLTATIARLAAHLAPDGIVVVEAFFGPTEFEPGRVDAVFVDEPDLKIARMSLSKRMGKIAILDYHYLVASKTGVERHFERHELGLFDDATYRDAFADAGLALERCDLSEEVFRRRVFAGIARG